MRPTICLNMIVRNEAHIVTQTLDSVCSRIDYWVVVDTGSNDGTIPLIQSYFREKRIPGEIHERPWKNFGDNRSEALNLAQGKADYIWVMDADDLLIGNLDLSRLTLDSYLLKFDLDVTYWRRQIFRSGVRWAYRGVVHEYPVCLDASPMEGRIDGDYYIESRRLGHRNLAADKCLQDARLLQETLKHTPDDARTVFYLAQSYFDARVLDQALHYYTLRSQMGGWDEEVYSSLFCRAVCLELLGQGWAVCQDAYLAAWRSRPGRAEALHQIARHHRLAGRFDLGYLFAQAAGQIPYPGRDLLFIPADVHTWRIQDELSICAYYLKKYQESFDICTRLLESRRVPEHERARIFANRDYSIPHIEEETSVYPEATVRKLHRRSGASNAKGLVTLTITASQRLEFFEKTVNSFLNCCQDLSRIARWICVDEGSSAAERERMRARYPFFEFVWKGPGQEGRAAGANIIAEMVETPYLLQLEDEWHFFVRDRYVARSIAILRDDPKLGQVLFNRNYGDRSNSWRIAGGKVKFTRRDSIRYRLHQHFSPGTAEYEQYLQALPAGARTMANWPHYSLRPSMVAVSALRGTGRCDATAGNFELEYAERYRDTGFRSAFFDSINCFHLGKRTSEVEIEPAKT